MKLGKISQTKGKKSRDDGFKESKRRYGVWGWVIVVNSIAQNKQGGLKIICLILQF